VVLKAWLVTWEWGNDAAAVDGRILCGHNPWLHARIVSEFAERRQHGTRDYLMEGARRLQAW